MFDLYPHGYGARLGTSPPTGPLKQSGSRYVAQASPRLKGTSTLQGCWGQPAASEGRPQAPPHKERAAGRLEPKWLRTLSLSLSLSLSLFFNTDKGKAVNPPPRAYAPCQSRFSVKQLQQMRASGQQLCKLTLSLSPSTRIKEASGRSYLSFPLFFNPEKHSVFCRVYLIRCLLAHASRILTNNRK